MRCYKLTDENGLTRGNTQWGEGVRHDATGDSGQPLCSNGWIHGHESLEIAALLNPIYGKFRLPLAWVAETHGDIRREGRLKLGSRGMTTLRQVELPKYTPEQLAEIVIRGALAVDQGGCPPWTRWATAWLDGTDTDRSAKAAAEAAKAAEAAEAAKAAAGAVEAAWAVLWAAEAEAAGAAEAAWGPGAAWAALWAAEADWGTGAAWAARATRGGARAAAWGIEDAANAAEDALDLQGIIEAVLAGQEHQT